MSGFENYFQEAAALELEIERKGVALGIDWNNPLQVRALAQDALSHKPRSELPIFEQLPIEERARIELFGLAQLMLTVMRESAEQHLETHGGPVWKIFSRALWQEALSQGLLSLERTK